MSSSPFQSQTFTWLNQQRIRWKDRLGQGWRSMQLGLTWGLQIALYPIYVLVQSSRLLLRQWQTLTPPELSPQPVSAVSPRLLGIVDSVSEPIHAKISAAPQPDLIDRFLGIVEEEFGFKVHPAETRPTLQGIASLCIPSQTQAARSLVWVDDQNRLWTVPSPQQQALQYHIFNLLLHHAIPNDRRVAALKLLPDRPQQLPPVRWLHRLLNWMHTSPLALQTNLFQEAQGSALIPQPPFPNPLPPKLQGDLYRFSLLQGDALLRFLDYHLAQWEPRRSALTHFPQSDRSASVSPDRIPPLPVSRLINPPLTSAIPSAFSSILEMNPPDTMPDSPSKTIAPGQGSSDLVHNVSLPIHPQKEINTIVTTKSAKFFVDQVQAADQDIEVISLTVGYVKHPLEHLLHWLDRVMTWIEHQLARFWKIKN